MLAATARRTLITWGSEDTDTKTPIQNEEYFNSAALRANGAFYEELNTDQKRLLKGDITTVIGDLNAKIGSDNTLLGWMKETHGLGDRKNIGKRFVAFCTFHCFVFGGTTFEQKSYIILGRFQLTSNQQ